MADEEGLEQVDVQKRYLMAKINELTDGIGPGYAQALMEELITRMERTVAHFHDEVTELLGVLKSRSKETDDKLKSLAVVEGTEAGEEVEETVSSAEKTISDWERKIESMEAGDETVKKTAAAEPPNEEEKPKKKGLFGRKKK